MQSLSLGLIEFYNLFILFIITGKNLRNIEMPAAFQSIIIRSTLHGDIIIKYKI